jgi:hypothetical protein
MLAKFELSLHGDWQLGMHSRFRQARDTAVRRVAGTHRCWLYPVTRIRGGASSVTREGRLRVVPSGRDRMPLRGRFAATRTTTGLSSAGDLGRFSRGAG